MSSSRSQALAFACALVNQGVGMTASLLLVLLCRDPAELGLWTLCTSLAGYMAFADLGLSGLLARRLARLGPAAAVALGEASAGRFARTAGTLALSAGLVASLALTALPLIGDYSWGQAGALAAAAVAGAAIAWSNIRRVAHRGAGRWPAFIRVDLGMESLPALARVAGASFGALAMAGATLAVNMAVAVSLGRTRTTLARPLPWQQLLLGACPFLLSGLAGVMVATAARWLMAPFLGLHDIGLYAAAATGAALVLAVASGIQNILTPAAGAAIASGQANRLKTPFFLLLATLSCTGLAVAILFPLVLPWFAPAYSDAALMVPPLAAAAVCQGLVAQICSAAALGSRNAWIGPLGQVIAIAMIAIAIPTTLSFKPDPVFAAWAAGLAGGVALPIALAMVARSAGPSGRWIVWLGLAGTAAVAGATWLACATSALTTAWRAGFGVFAGMVALACLGTLLRSARRMGERCG